jgi:uncharacterized protein YgbK (DUF1537 family)
MQVTVDIPDDVAERLKAAGGDLSRRALEALALEAYKRRQLTSPTCAASLVSAPATPSTVPQGP